jgi:hypothetical protein
VTWSDWPSEDYPNRIQPADDVEDKALLERVRKEAPDALDVETDETAYSTKILTHLTL